MGKAYSKAAKMRAKRRARQWGTVPDGCELPDVKKSPRRGRPPVALVAIEADPQKQALGARCKAMGMTDTVKNRIALTAPYSGSDVGRCIDACARTDKAAARLWQTFCGYCATHEQYARLVLGASPHAKGASIQMVPEPMEADQSHTVDLRTHDERIADAKESRRRWDGLVAQLPGAYVHALAFARLGGGPRMWDHGRGPTVYGGVTVDAVAALADLVEGG